MTPRPARTASRFIALVLLAAMALVPQAMAWADAMPPAAMAMTPADLHPLHHHPAGPRHEPTPDRCCELCLTTCVTCAGIVGAGSVLPYRQTPWHVRTITTGIVGPSESPAFLDQRQLPFALGPPSRHR